MRCARDRRPTDAWTGDTRLYGNARACRARDSDIHPPTRADASACHRSSTHPDADRAFAQRGAQHGHAGDLANAARDGEPLADGRTDNAPSDCDLAAAGLTDPNGDSGCLACAGRDRSGCYSNRRRVCARRAEFDRLARVSGV